MSEIVQVNKGNQTIPTIDDQNNWGEFTTEFFRSIAENSGVDYTKTVFLQKNGDASFSGYSPSKAKSTLNDAIDAAVLLAPLSTNRISIYILDEGVYTYGGATVLPSFIDIIGPGATIDVDGVIGPLELNNNNVFVNTLRTSVASQTILEIASGDNRVKIDNLVESGSPASVVGMDITGGQVEADFGQIVLTGATSDALEQSAGTAYVSITGEINATQNAVNQSAGTMYLLTGTLTGTVVNGGTYSDVIISAGGTNAAGADTQVQYNDGGAFGADGGLSYNKNATSPRLTLSGSSNSEVQVSDGSNVLSILSDTVNPRLRAQGAANTLIIDNTSATGVQVENAFFDAGTTLNYPTADGTAGQVLVTDGAGNLSFSSSGVVGGADTNVQYNDAGGFAGSSDLTYNKSAATGEFTLTGSSTARIFSTAGGVSAYLESIGVNAQVRSTGGATFFRIVNDNTNGVLVENALFNAGTQLNYPTADGASGEALTTDGAGNLSFSAVVTGAAAPSTSIQYNNGGAFAGDSLFVFDSSTKKVGINIATPLRNLHVVGTGGAATDAPITGQSDRVTIKADRTVDSVIQILGDPTGVTDLWFSDSGFERQGYIRYYHSSDDMVFAASGTEYNVIDGATGFTAFGTTGTPNERVHIDGRLYMTQNAAPGTTTDRLYNVAGNLFWNGVQLDSFATPAGADTQIQYNDSGSFGASSKFVFDESLGKLTLSDAYNEAVALLLQSTTDGVTFRTEATNPLYYAEILYTNGFDPELFLKNGNASPSASYMRIRNDRVECHTTTMQIQNTNAGSIEVKLAFSDKITINSTQTQFPSNDVGIGVAPGFKLQIGGETTQFPVSLKIDETTHGSSSRSSMQFDDWIIGQDASGSGSKDFFFSKTTGGLIPMVIDTDGQIVMGNAVFTPTEALEIRTDTTAYLKINSGAGVGSTAGGIKLYDNDTHNWTIDKGTANNLNFISVPASNTLDVKFDLTAGTGNRAVTLDTASGSQGRINFAQAGASKYYWAMQTTGTAFLLRDVANSKNAIDLTSAGNLGLNATAGSVGVRTSSPTSFLHVAGSYAGEITTISTATTLTSSHQTILADATGGAFTLTLPAASTCSGRIYRIKRINSGANAVTVDGNGSETIDGSLTAVFNAQYDGFTIQSNGTNWFILF